MQHHVNRRRPSCTGLDVLINSIDSQINSCCYELSNKTFHVFQCIIQVLPSAYPTAPQAYKNRPNAAVATALLWHSYNHNLKILLAKPILPALLQIQTMPGHGSLKKYRCLSATELRCKCYAVARTHLASGFRCNAPTISLEIKSLVCQPQRFNGERRLKQEKSEARLKPNTTAVAL